jgi:hypothetical protein
MASRKNKSKRTFCYSEICRVMVACDGNNITAGRTMCGVCENKLAKKSKDKPLKLRGETHVKYEDSRRGR